MWTPLSQVFEWWISQMSAFAMGDSFTLTLSETSSVLEAHYFPPIELSPFKNYALDLVDLLTFNSIPNVDEGKNKFYVAEEPLYLWEAKKLWTLKITCSKYYLPVTFP